MWRFGCFFFVALSLVTGAVAVGVFLAAAAVGLVAVSDPIRVIAVIALLVGVVAVLGVGRMVRRFVRPVGGLVEAAGRIEEGDYSARVPERGPREVRSLARAFNAMSARLEATDRERRAFLADVSHELRTPLSVIQGHLEAVLDGVYPADPKHLAPILDEARTLEQLVDDLRTLALAESGSLPLVREPVDLAVLANETAAAHRAAADSGGVAIRIDVAAELPPVEADPARIRRVLGNLVTNALRHTPAGGSVTVTAHREEEMVVVEVTDTGSGIETELLPRIFDRFVKAEGSPGSGLGLAIARDVVVAHGGTIAAESDRSRGTTIRFSLPIGSG